MTTVTHVKLDVTENISYLEELPPYLLEKLLLNLPPKDLNKIFTASKNIKNQYDNKRLWTRKLKQDFGNPETFKDQYKKKYASEHIFSLDKIKKIINEKFNKHLAKNLNLFVEEQINLKELIDFVTEITKNYFNGLGINSILKIFNLEALVENSFPNFILKIYKHYHKLLEAYDPIEDILEDILDEDEYFMNEWDSYFSKEFDPIVNYYPFILEFIDEYLSTDFMYYGPEYKYNKKLFEYACKLAIKSNRKSYL